MATVLDEGPSRIEVRDDLFYITGVLGCKAVRPRTFFEGLLLAEEAYAKWQLAQLANSGNVVDFPRS